MSRLALEYVLPVRWDDDEASTNWHARSRRGCGPSAHSASRQAFDDLAQRVRLPTFLAVVPLAVSAVAAGRPVVAASVALAEPGRRRAGGATVYPVSTALLAPV